jgi:diguanylate cyclase (GGDEF)-like protein
MDVMNPTDLAELASHRPRPLLLPRELSDEEFALFCASGSVRDVPQGSLIFQRGELGRSMFVIEEGQVQLEFGDGLPDKLIGPREFFGELALFIGNHARVANASAASKVRLHVIDAGAFEGILHRAPVLVAQFMRRSFAYLVASEQTLIQSLKRRNEDLLVTVDSLRQTRTRLDSVERLTQLDELTGIANRRGLYAFLEGLEEQRLPDTRLGLMLVDLDRFKQINDHHGHLLRDVVLRAIARELQNAAAPCDLPVRLGGDEFALLLQVPDLADLEARARQVVMAIRALRFPDPNASLRVTVSVGAILCNEEEEWSQWYAEADSALYEVKGAGGDAYRVLDSKP